MKRMCASFFILAMAVGLAVAAVTFSVTGIDCGELDAPVLATETEPV